MIYVSHHLEQNGHYLFRLPQTKPLRRDWGFLHVRQIMLEEELGCYQGLILSSILGLEPSRWCSTAQLPQYKQLCQQPCLLLWAAVQKPRRYCTALPSCKGYPVSFLLLLGVFQGHTWALQAKSLGDEIFAKTDSCSWTHHSGGVSQSVRWTLLVLCNGHICKCLQDWNPLASLFRAKWLQDTGFATVAF